MKKYLVIISFLITSYLQADSDEQNLEALKEWIATKRAVTVDERGGSLSVSGDIHVEYITLSEQRNSFKNIGPGSFHPIIPENQFDIEFNFMLDFRNDITWATTKLKFDNDAGILSGTFDRLFLERAFFGFHLFETELTSVDLEFGRRFLGYTFDSRIQFGSLMDGILLKINKTTERFGDIYLFAAPFVVNEILSHVSFVIELGILNIANTGFYAKYSLIDWKTKSFSNEIINNQFSSINNQFILGYRFQSPFFNAITIVYGAFLVNAAAKPFTHLNNRKDNMAGYFGITMGEIRKKKDWSFDLNFQFVQPQAIPALDFSGIGIYNPDDLILYVLEQKDAVSNGNYWGFQIYFLYALQDTITLAQSISFSRPLMEMPNKFNFQKYKLELIYAW